MRISFDGAWGLIGCFMLGLAVGVCIPVSDRGSLSAQSPPALNSTIDLSTYGRTSERPDTIRAIVWVGETAETTYCDSVYVLIMPPIAKDYIGGTILFVEQTFPNDEGTLRRRRR